MTALPTTAEFITYESMYLPKNHFIKEESLSPESYVDYFYPFNKMDFHKKGIESSWSVSSGYVCIWRHIPDLPYRISGKCTGYRMELSFPARHNPDVLFFYAYGF